MTPLPEATVADSENRLASALGDRYAIERELGRGGMATVYLAEDLKHHRRVAIKMLRPELAAALGPERFLQEIATAARLNHPHILSLHDSGEAHGLLYYVMPFVDGASLRDRLDRERQLPLEDALSIAREVAEALDYAHRHGVLHRDIKPENIVLSEGHAYVSDFGIACALKSPEVERLTGAGLILGTPAYMSPEQATADRELDGRSDLYALACVVYEMLAGTPPFAGASKQAVIARHIADAVPSLRAVRDGIPFTVERALLKALAKIPGDRFATGQQFIEALESERLATDERSLAVLPFANLSPDPGDDYFSDGMTEEIITALSGVQALRVAARTSSFAFKGRNADVRVIGRELNVATVLEGSVRRVGRRLRVTAQLIDVGDGYHIWSARYDRDAEDVFAIQDEIANKIATALEVVLAEPKRRALEKPQTRSLEAYDCFLRGRRFFHQFRRAGFEAALGLFEQAIALDPRYARAHAGVADCWSLLNTFSSAHEESARLADAASRRALELDPGLAEAHASRGLALSVNHRFEEAQREFENAIGLDPGLFEAYGFHARASLAQGNHLRAAEMFERAIELRPEDYEAAALLAGVYAGLGRPAAAEAAARRAMEKVERHLEHYPYDARALCMGASVLSRLGETAKAETWAARALSIDRDEPAILYNICCTYALIGRFDEAIDCLERCAAAGFVNVLWFEHDTDLDPLRGQERFQAILARARHPAASA